MLETTRIRREGYAVRPVFAEFIERCAHCPSPSPFALPSLSLSLTRACPCPCPCPCPCLCPFPCPSPSHSPCPVPVPVPAPAHASFKLLRWGSKVAVPPTLDSCRTILSYAKIDGWLLGSVPSP